MQKKKPAGGYGAGSISETAAKRKENIATSGMSQSARNIYERTKAEKSPEGDLQRGRQTGSRKSKSKK